MAKVDLSRINHVKQTNFLLWQDNRSQEDGVNYKCDVIWLIKTLKLFLKKTRETWSWGRYSKSKQSDKYSCHHKVNWHQISWLFLKWMLKKSCQRVCMLYPSVAWNYDFKE